MKIFKKILKFIPYIILLLLVGLFIAGSVLRPSEVSNAAARSALSDSEVIQSAETLAAAPDTAQYPTANMFDLSGAHSAGGVTVTTDNNTITFNGTATQDYIVFFELDITDQLTNGEYYTFSYTYDRYSSSSNIPVFQVFEQDRATKEINYLTASSDILWQNGYYTFPVNTYRYTYTLYILSGIQPQYFDCTYKYMFNVGQVAYPYIPNFDAIYNEGYDEGYTDGTDTEYGNNGYNATYMTVPGYFIYGHQMPDPVAEEDFYVTPLIQSFGGYADNTGTATQGGSYYIGTDKHGSYQDIVQRYDFGSDTRTTTIINNYGNSEYNQFPNMTYEYYFKEYINYINIQRGSRYLPTLYIEFYDYSAVSSGSENSHYSIDITLYDFIETDTPVTGEELYNALLSQVRSQYNVITGITWRDIYIYSSNLLTPGEYVLNVSNYSDWITDAASDAYQNGFNAGVASGTAPSQGFLDSVLTALNSLFTNVTNLLGTEIAPGLNIGLFVIGIPASFMILDLIISLILKFLGRGGSSSS